MVLSYSVSDPIRSHLYCSGLFFAVLIAMLFASVLSVATGVGGCWWPISSRAILVDVAFWQFSKISPNYASLAYSMTFLVMLHYTCTGPFFGGIAWIGVLDFGTRKNIHLSWFVPLLLMYRMHLIKCQESFRFFYILLLRLYFLRCNLKLSYLFCSFNFLLFLYLCQWV